MTRTLILVRHGETDWNAEGRWQGQRDVPLSETGRAQARLLAVRLERLWASGQLPGPPQRLWTSDLSRAQETAQLLTLGLPLDVDPRLRERSFGSWEGKTSAEVGHAPGTGERAADAEPADAVWERVLAAVETIWQADEPVSLIVGHGGALRAILARAAGLGTEGMGRFQLANTALSILHFSGPTFSEATGRLVRVNDTAHLEN